MRCGPACVAWQRHSTVLSRVSDVMAENFRRRLQCFLNIFRLLFAFGLLFLSGLDFSRLLCKHLKSLIRSLAVFCLVCSVLIRLDFITPRSFVERPGSRALWSNGDSCYGILIQCRSGIIPVSTSKQDWGGEKVAERERERDQEIEQVGRNLPWIFPNPLTLISLSVNKKH